MRTTLTFAFIGRSWRMLPALSLTDAALMWIAADPECNVPGALALGRTGFSVDVPEGSMTFLVQSQIGGSNFPGGVVVSRSGSFL